MGQHRKPRATASTRGSSRADHRPRTPGPILSSVRDGEPARDDLRPASGVGARALEDLVHVARTARRAGWPFGSALLASADTCQVPTPPAVRPVEGLPRRYATHQPTEPIPVSASR